ncbi:ECF transporter S component [uncultured Neglectibacter sp.]|uniref:ECF transporter S component n=1 Tax=uncultured Neglectibacter sp. TaxID=1924108 RepID=UPI0034DFCB2C
MQKKFNARKLAVTAVMGAVAAVLMFLSFSVPVIPSFIKLDFSELPALIAAFSMGPLSGAAVCFVKNLVNVLFTSTAGAGELCNFLMGVTFVVPAGLIYKKQKNLKGAVIGSLVGAAVMAVCSLPINYFISYPAYSLFYGLTTDIILGMYRAINPNVGSLFDALLWFNAPFTFVKGLCDVVLTFLVYKRLSPVIKKLANI